MDRKVYLNKGEGRGREVAAIVAILLVVLAGAAVLIRLFPDEAKEDLGVPMARAPGSTEDECDDLDRSSEYAGSFFTLSTKEVKALWSMIRNSDHVRLNRQYETVINNTRLIYDNCNDRVNAGARFEDTRQVLRPRITLLGGEARFERLIAYARAIDLECGTTNAVNDLVEMLTQRDVCIMPETRARQLYSSCGFTNFLSESMLASGTSGGDRNLARRIKARADKITSGIILGSLAHEAGHVALGHCHDTEPGRSNLDVSRNQEREADSFGSSVMASSSYGSYMFESTLYSWLVMALKESGVEKGHPLARERFENIVRSNKRLAKELGIEVKSKGDFD